MVLLKEVQDELSKKKGQTTPQSDQNPIGKVSISDRIVLHAFNVASDGFRRYPLVQRKVTIHARLIYRDVSKPAEAYHFEFSGGGPVKSSIPITKEELKSVTKVEVWVDPYGYGALLDSRKKSALGRLSIDFTSVKVDDVSCSDYTIKFEVLQSVVQFIVNEMNANKNNADVKECARLNAESASLKQAAAAQQEKAKKLGWLEASMEERKASQKEAQSARMKEKAENIWSKKVHTNSLAMNVYFLGGGEWDHKPIISPIWGENERLGDSESTYFYDIWSNIHYGYVGILAGFTGEELYEGANQQQTVDSASDDETADHDSIEEGIGLAKKKGNVTVDDVVQIVNRHPDWQYVERKKKWDAQKKR